MKKKSLIALSLLAAFLGLSTHSFAWSAHVKNYKSIRIDGKMSKAEVGAAIKKGITNRDWTVGSAVDGVITASFEKGKYSATVQIKYSATEYSIMYKDSENFKYNEDKESISAQYNIWVTNLQHSIAAELR